jgi:hypothetical protein
MTALTKKQYKHLMTRLCQIAGRRPAEPAKPSHVIDAEISRDIAQKVINDWQTNAYNARNEMSNRILNAKTKVITVVLFSDTEQALSAVETFDAEVQSWIGEANNTIT